MRMWWIVRSMTPLPRTSRRASAGRICRSLAPFVAGADAIASWTSPRPARSSRFVLGGAYTACGGPSNGVSRSPTSGQFTTPIRTEHRPPRMTMQTSDSSVATTKRAPLPTRAVEKLT